MPRKYQVISADGHLETPVDLSPLLPKKYQPRAPKLVEIPGGQGWVVEGRPVQSSGLAVNGGRRPIDPGVVSYYTPEGKAIPGTGSPEQRLQEQDKDGIDAEVLFPSYQNSKMLDTIVDPDCYNAIIQAYNTWLAQEYCGSAPDRLIGLGQLPGTGVADAIAEIRRCKELGLKGVVFHKFPNGSGKAMREDDRFWDVAQEIDMALCAHVTFGDSPPSMVPPPPFAAHMSGGVLYPFSQMMELLVFDKFRHLNIYLAETGASWMPGGMHGLDSGYERYRSGFSIEYKKWPTEYLKEHAWFSFADDKLAVDLGFENPVIDKLLWGSAFPREFSPFPNSRAFLDGVFKNSPAALRQKVLVENPCQFFGLDPNKTLTETP